MNPTGLGCGAVADSCEHDNEPWVPYKAWNFLTRWTTRSVSRTPLHGVS